MLTHRPPSLTRHRYRRERGARTSHRRRVTVGTSAVALLLSLAAPAGAHVDAVTNAPAEPGSTITLGFTFHHGCAGAPTIALAVQMPDEVDIETVEPLTHGEWEAEVDDGVIRWTGGRPVPDGQDEVFEVELTLPDLPGETLHFPTIQRCQDEQYDWIEIAVDDQDPADLEQPAPRLTLDGEPAEAGDRIEHDPAEGMDRQDAVGPDDLEPEPEPVEEDEATVAADEDEDEGVAPLLAIGLILMLAAVGAGALVAMRRGPDGDDSGSEATDG
jgi:periplasmic copper chaperone A